MQTVSEILLNDKYILPKPKNKDFLVRLTKFLANLNTKSKELNNYLDKLFRIEVSNTNSIKAADKKVELIEKVEKLEAEIKPSEGVEKNFNKQKELTGFGKDLKSTYLENVRTALKAIKNGVANNSEKLESLQENLDSSQRAIEDAYLSNFTLNEPLLERMKRDIQYSTSKIIEKTSVQKKFEKQLNKEFEDLGIFNITHKSHRGIQVFHHIINSILHDLFQQNIEDLLSDIDDSSTLNLPQKQYLKSRFLEELNFSGKMFKRVYQEPKEIFIKELKEKYALPENMENNTAMLHIYCPELVKVFKTILSKKELDTALKEIEIFRPITINYFKADNFLNENVTNKLIEAHFSPWMTKFKNELIESNQSSFSSGFTNELVKRFTEPNLKGLFSNKKSIGKFLPEQGYLKNITKNTYSSRIAKDTNTLEIFKNNLENLKEILKENNNLSEEEEEQFDAIQKNTHWIYNFENRTLFPLTQKQNQVKNFKFIADLRLRIYYQQAQKQFYKDLDQFKTEMNCKEHITNNIKRFFYDYHKIPGIEIQYSKIEKPLSAFVTWKRSKLTELQNKNIDTHLVDAKNKINIRSQHKMKKGFEESQALFKIYLNDLIKDIQGQFPELSNEDNISIENFFIHSRKFLKSPFKAKTQYLNSAIESSSPPISYATKKLIADHLCPWHKKLESNIYSQFSLPNMTKSRNYDKSWENEHHHAFRSIYPFVNPITYNEIISNNEEKNYFQDIRQIKSLCTKVYQDYLAKTNNENPKSFTDFYYKHCRVEAEKQGYAMPKIEELGQLYENKNISQVEILRDIFSLDALSREESEQLIYEALKDKDKYQYKIDISHLSTLDHRNPMLNLNDTELQEAYSKYFYNLYQEKLLEKFDQNSQTKIINLSDWFLQTKRDLGMIPSLTNIKNNIAELKELPESEFIFKTLKFLSNDSKSLIESKVNEYKAVNKTLPENPYQFYSQIQKESPEILKDINKLKLKDQYRLLKLLFPEDENKKKLLTKELLYTIEEHGEVTQLIVLKNIFADNPEIMKLLKSNKIKKIIDKNIPAPEFISSEDLEKIINELDLQKGREENKIKAFKVEDSEILNTVIPFQDYFLNSTLNKLWNEVNQDPTRLESIIQESQSSNPQTKYIAESFLEEFKEVNDFTKPKNFSKEIEPNDMQKLAVLRLLESPFNSLGNWSAPGTGKTIASLLASAILESEHTLIIGPNSVIADPKEWQKQIKEAIPQSKINAKVNQLELNDKKANFTLLNYELLNAQASKKSLSYLESSEIPIDFIIIDEAHHLLDKNSDQYKNINTLIKNLRAKDPDIKILFMSGTPIINKIEEAHSLHSVILQRDLEYDPNNTFINHTDAHILYNSNSVRFKQDYPYKYHEIKINIDEQGSEIKERYENELKANTTTGSKDRVLIKYKLPELAENLKKKAVIYCEYTDQIIPEIKKYLDECPNFTVGMYTGEYKKDIVDFKKGDKDILILSPAGAEGINLQEASSVHLLINPWTHAREEQVIRRVARLGQEEPVDVFKYIVTSNDAELTPDEHKEQIVKEKSLLEEFCLDDSFGEIYTHQRLKKFLNNIKAKALKFEAQKFSLTDFKFKDIDDPQKYLNLNISQIIKNINSAIYDDLDKQDLTQAEYSSIKPNIDKSLEEIKNILKSNETLDTKSKHAVNAFKKISKHLDAIDKAPLSIQAIYDKVYNILKVKYETNYFYLQLCNIEADSEERKEKDLKELAAFLMKSPNSDKKINLQSLDKNNIYKKLFVGVNNKNNSDELRAALQIYLKEGSQHETTAQHSITMSLDIFLKLTSLRLKKLESRLAHLTDNQENSEITKYFIKVFTRAKKNQSGYYQIPYTYIFTTILKTVSLYDKYQLLKEKDPELYGEIIKANDRLQKAKRKIKEEYLGFNDYNTTKQKQILEELSPLVTYLKSLRERAGETVSNYNEISLDKKLVDKDGENNAYHMIIASDDVVIYDQQMQFLLDDFNDYINNSNQFNNIAEAILGVRPHTALERSLVNRKITFAANDFIDKMFKDPDKYLTASENPRQALEPNFENKEIEALTQLLSSDNLDKGQEILLEIYSKLIIPFFEERQSENAKNETSQEDFDDELREEYI